MPKENHERRRTEWACSRMTYTYTSKGAARELSEEDTQKLCRGLHVLRDNLTVISRTISSLNSRLEHGIAQAIWDEAPLTAVASAAGITTTKAISVGLSHEDLPNSDTPAEKQLQKIRDAGRQLDKLRIQQQNMRRQQEQLVILALTNSVLDETRVAAIAGLSPERVNLLAQRTRPTTDRPN
jgi:hypothetical protein